MPFEFETLPLPDVVVAKPRLFTDSRGMFAELFKQSAFQAAGIAPNFTQVNYSRSGHHVLRGLHYQAPPHEQGKLVGVLQGEIFDVAVDIRSGSSTFGQYVSRTLTSDQLEFLYVPPGFAHGFCVLSAEAHVMYFTTSEYEPAAERGIMWNDPALAIAWPVDEPVLSEKDMEYPPLELPI